MTREDDRPGDGPRSTSLREALRRQAEELARGGAPPSPGAPPELPPGEAQRALHELRVREIELGLLHEELLRARAELDSARTASDAGEEAFREVELELTTRLVLLVNSEGDFRELVSGLTAELQRWSGCEAVGIRLRDGDDYPYYETRGFPPEFVEAERQLCAYGPDGRILRDGQGDPVLECMCGNVLCGRFDPARPFFTARGSFWSNCTTDLLTGTTEADRQARTRNRCNGEGYESVALVALRVGDDVLGLLQFNDRRRGRFTGTRIARFERLADNLAIALSRRRVEAALRESEERYRGLFEHMAEGYAYCRVLYEDGEACDWVYLSVNQAFEDLTGLKGVVGRRVTEVLPGVREADPGLFEIYSRVARTGRHEKFEVFVESLQQWFSISVHGPRPGHFVAIFDVITERKRAEAELQESKARLELAQRSAGAGTWDWDMVSQRLVWSRELYVLFGLDPDGAEATFDTWNQVLHPEDRDGAQQRIERAIRENAPLHSEYRVVHPDGRVRWISALGNATYDPAGRPVRMSGICTDITERKRAEEDYRTLFREMLDGFALHEIICDEAGRPVDYRFLAVNPAFERMTGLEGRDILGRTVLEVMPGTERHWIETYGKVALTGEPAFFESASAELQMHFEVTAFRPAPGQFACIFADITDRRQAAAEKARLAAQLQQAQKMESVGRLAGGVAHDFNNMLGVILGHAELALRRTDPSQPLHVNLTEIHRAASRSADLTRQLLAFARRQTVAPRVLDLNETVSGMLRMLERLIGEDISLSWRPGADLWPVRVDPSQIDQVLANLCVNARDSIAGVGRITIETSHGAFDQSYGSTHAGFVPGEYVRLSVSDDGCGMDKETQAHLFEPFFTTKEVGKGTGLGLATIYGIVKQNQGFISVTSEPGSGTTFTIHLPRHVGRSETAGTEDEPRPVPRGEATILLVEDEPAILRMITTMLGMRGYTVLAAGTPGEAIQLARERAGEIHLLVTDVVMPEMNGRDLAKNLLSLYPHLKRLFMSGYTADVIAHHGVLEEGVHFIQKPFSAEALAAKVREALESD